MRSKNSTQGSVLIVALMFALVIAIVLTSYLRLSLITAKNAHRSFYLNGAQDLVDQGLEQALWSLNNKTWTTAGFAARPSYTNQYQGAFPDPTASPPANYYQLSGGVQGRVKVWIDIANVAGGYAAPHAVALATITFGDGTQLVKQAEAYMEPRSIFDNQFATKGNITLSGNNVYLDGWDSHSDTASHADDVTYADNSDHTLSANDDVKVASLAILNAISVGQADIHGTVSIGGSSSSAVNVGNNGSVGPYETSGLDSNSITYDYTTNFPEVTPKTTIATSGSINGILSLPSGRTPDSYVVDNIDGYTYAVYSVPSISLAGNTDIITIEPGAHVQITVTGDVSATGNNSGFILSDTPAIATPTVLRPSSLKLYVAGNVSIAGQGVVNGSLAGGYPTSAPLNFQLYGTKSDADAASGMQTFSIKGNGFFNGVIDAPNANLTINGGGDVYGGIVANTASLTGGGNFHGDESLARISFDGSWKLSKWRELSTSADRAAYSAELAF